MPRNIRTRKGVLKELPLAGDFAIDFPFFAQTAISTSTMKPPKRVPNPKRMSSPLSSFLFYTLPATFWDCFALPISTAKPNIRAPLEISRVSAPNIFSSNPDLSTEQPFPRHFPKSRFMLLNLSPPLSSLRSWRDAIPPRPWCAKQRVPNPF
jgi:hypothetical protein